MKFAYFKVLRRPVMAATIICCAALAAGSAAAQMPAPPARSAVSASKTPDAVAQFGAVAQDLFEQADARKWPRAKLDLQHLRTLAGQFNAAFEPRFADAGGQMEQLFSARNHLAADIAEAESDVRTRDRRALMGAANRMTLIAGELARPFADAATAPLALKVYTAMYLARQMRAAGRWGDSLGYELARQDFTRLWTEIRKSMPPADQKDVQALDAALERAAVSRTPQSARAVQVAAQVAVAALREAPAPKR